MRRKGAFSAAAALLLACPACAGDPALPAAPLPQGAPAGRAAAPREASAPAGTLADRVAPPPGFRRPAVAPFGEWLRALPLLPGRPPVLLHDGRPKTNQQAHAAVFDVSVGERDLQQCADAAMRLRAEFLRAAGCADEAAFDFTSGDRAAWSDWRAGMRPASRGTG